MRLICRSKRMNGIDSQKLSVRPGKACARTGSGRGPVLGSSPRTGLVQLLAAVANPTRSPSCVAHTAHDPRTVVARGIIARAVIGPTADGTRGDRCNDAADTGGSTYNPRQDRSRPSPPRMRPATASPTRRPRSTRGNRLQPRRIRPSFLECAWIPPVESRRPPVQALAWRGQAMQLNMNVSRQSPARGR